MINRDKAYFDEGAEKWISESYNEDGSMAKIRLNMVNDLISQSGPISILDVGCGDGRFLSELYQATRRVGIDFSNNMIKLAKRNNPDILFSNIDLNDAVNLQALNKLGAFDCITMMGVVHYLPKPSLTLNCLKNCLSESADLIISFRNRLYNVNSDSKYHHSDLTIRDLSLLNQELELWSQSDFLNSDLLDAIKTKGKSERLLQKLKKLDFFEGVNDNHWNPDGFDNWRQFTPINSILLLENVGLKSVGLIPLNKDLRYLREFSKLSNEKKANNLQKSSSFLIVAKRIH